jgi:ATP-dependent RNA helicase DDX47/RRP3
LGAPLGVKSLTIVGGLDMMTQAIGLAKKPHVIIGTPGRLVDHLQNTKGFTLDRLKFLVFDEADRLLNMEFEKEINQILEIAPKERTTFLFSATMTSQVAKLQKASLRSPVKLEVSQSKYQTVKTLIQNYVFVPAKHKDCYLVYMLSEEFSGSSTIIFTDTVRSTQKLTIMLRNLGFQAVPLHGKMTQPKRLGALNKFKSGASSSGNYILIATDVASRGLDIPSVDLVVNYDIPTHSKDYIHRVGRTARAGRSGRSLTMVTQYDVELYQRIEALIEKKMDLYPLEPERVLVFAERVSEAQRMATIEMRDLEEGKGKKNDFLSAEKFFKKKTEKSRKQK